MKHSTKLTSITKKKRGKTKVKHTNNLLSFHEDDEYTI